MLFNVLKKMVIHLVSVEMLQFFSFFNWFSGLVTVPKVSRALKAFMLNETYY